jgi:hypothetical protein
VEDERAGQDGQRVHADGRKPRGREAPAVLERELERRERKTARSQHDRNQNEVGAASHGLLRRDVGGRIQDPGRGREADARRQPAVGDSRDDCRDHEPERERQGRGEASSGAARERQPEEHEPGDGGDRSRPLGRVEASAGDGEHDHASRRGGLDERQRREPQRNHVRSPTAKTENSAGEPDPATDQGAERPHRAPERQGRKLCRLAVLQREPATDRACRREPEQQPGGRPRGHRPAGRVWNGR